MYLSYQLQTWSADRRRKGRTYAPEPCRSFLKQYLQLFYVDMADLSLSVLDITGVGRTISIDATVGNTLSLAHCGLAAVDDCSRTIDTVNSPGSGASPQNTIDSHQKGIIVGTSASAVVVTQTALQAPVVHGTGAGQLTHYGTWGKSLSYGSSPGSFIIERIWRNDSGGTITVAEMGLYVAVGTGSGMHSFCIVRDVLGASVGVLANEYLKSEYTFQMTT